MADLLLEVGCEELPSSACREILEQAPDLVARALAAAGHRDEGGVQVWVAPRRFAVRVIGLPERLEAETRAVRGPAVEAAFGPDGAPTKAAQGFARAQGVAPEDLVVRESEGGRRFVFAERTEAGRELADVVPDVAARLVEGLRFSKTMRWGAGDGLRFSRPVRWLVAKVDELTVPFELHGLVAGEVSQGHRFLGGPAVIASPDAYHAALRGAAVIASHDARRAAIVADLDDAAAAAGGTWRDPGGKLYEVVFLVEWPSVITGRIAEQHLALPARVLVTAMQSHQRYFPLERPDGSLAPAFLAVSNGDPAHAEVITRGNEGVLDARLQDAAFSFAKDREAGLAALDARLDSIVFHQRLGTMAQKRDRLVANARELAAAVGADPTAVSVAAAAAGLAKADQGAVLVAEFSDLQGYVAAEYARLEGHDAAVCRAIEDQYLPEGPDSPLPSTGAGALVAASEKLDNLIGAFLVDEMPTGSKDPYGLRRAAAGLVRIMLEGAWDVPLRPLLAAAARAYRDQGADLVVEDDVAVDALEAFVADRLAFLLAEEGVGAEAAAAAEGAGLGGPVATAKWARAISAARDGEAFGRAWTAATRLSRLASKAPDDTPPSWADAGDPGEAALAAAVAEAAPEIEAARERRDFDAGLAAAAGLAPAVDRFFHDVMVNVDDPVTRARRYALIREAADTLTRVAEFGRVTEGGGR